MKYIQILFFLLIAQTLCAQTARITGKISSETTNESFPNVEVNLLETRETQKTDKQGKYIFENLQKGTFTLLIYAEGYQDVIEIIELKGDEEYIFNSKLKELERTLPTAQVEAESRKTDGLSRLNKVDGMGIYDAKKNEVIRLENLVANLATNNARQIYKGIAGLNIWENDGAGLQLSIGARGLDPNRTSNFNTRQNGYDISADALGYPESYYTPPAQALKRIEIVRGAASLQYGPQFGGLLNFIFKEGNPDKAFEFQTENTVGSFGLLTSFNSIGGEKNGWNYYAFYQRKQGDGWRPNSAFHQNTTYAKLSKKIGKKLKIGVEYTLMDYLAQQPGGLVDFEFEQDARQSKRERNWFKVNWNLAALTAQYKLTDKTKLDTRFFYLSAQRQALGILNQINRPDPLRERDLIRGLYNNFGNETRLIHRYGKDTRLATFLVGMRYYQGFSESSQGFADDTALPNFNYMNPNDLEIADYDFPSRNFSAFAENLFNINARWTVTPGVRFEYIRTAAEGFFKERVISGNQVILEQTFDVERSNPRSLFLLGLGTGYKVGKETEVYANFSQNYRSINFTDLAVVNPNLIVDSLLTDERGYNMDLGIRGSFKNFLTFDASLFFLNYRDRIGTGETILEDPILGEVAVPFRTNIGDARIFGLEAYADLDILKLAKVKNENFALSLFTNLSFLQGKYVTDNNAFNGRNVELIPPTSIKSGLTFRWKNLQTAYQYARVSEHFSDATNAEFTTDATRGIIPTYGVHDLSLSYVWKRLKLQTGVNNLTDARYFTRRAATYPGPGIIPADGRSVYLTVGLKL